MDPRSLVLALVILVTPATTACGAAGMTPAEVAVATAITVANTTRLGIESAETSALAVYRTAQLAAVERARAQQETVAAASAEVEAIRASFRPVWEALDAARDAHLALVTALAAYESGKVTAEAVVAAAKALAEASEKATGAIALARGARS